MSRDEPLTTDWLAKPGIGYQMSVPDLGVTIGLTRIRRERHETIGLLNVRVSFRGAKTIDNGLLSSADFNCSSLRARKERANHLQDRAHAKEIDWVGLLDDLCLRVLQAEEEGEPEVPLETIPLTDYAHGQADFVAGGLPLVKRLPSIWFGDGGSAKSYFALYAAVQVAQMGESVLYCDWEFSGEEHRLRLHRLVGPKPSLPNLFYRRCDRPLSREVTRLRDIVQTRKVTFVVCDSLGFAADSTPEGAEAATNYFRAVRELGPISSLHLAHISKAEDGDKRPFGSVFWANAARNIWYLKRDDSVRDKAIVPVGFYHRKSNTGALKSDFAMVAKFVGTETVIYPDDITNYPTLCEKLDVKDRVKAELAEAGQSLTRQELKDALGAKDESLRKALERGVKKGEFVQFGDRYGLPS